jgi:hypothetical protein
MKGFYFLIFTFLFSCSAKLDESMPVEPNEQQLTHFEKIFYNSNGVFNDYDLGTLLTENIFQTDSLSKLDYFTYSIFTSERKINKIEIVIHIKDQQESKDLTDAIIIKYNNLLNNQKPSSNFTSWTYTTDNNIPAEITLIYEKELSAISLEIGYKSQR